MSFVPIFIPMGGGGPPHPIIGLAGLALVIGMGVYLFVESECEPEFKIALINYKTYNINFFIRLIQNFPISTFAKHNNIECMEKKGYVFKNMEEGDKYIVSHRNGTKFGEIMKIDDMKIYDKKKYIDKNAFIADCSECKVSTEVKYKYETLNKKTKWGSRTFNWADNYEDELQ